jgi:pimeloyl-ACP methyl ester carboxylesterase
MSHPFGEEKLWAHRVFVSFARALAARGHIVLRFDYAGSGDSDGMTPDTSLETHLSDLSCALSTLRADHANIERVGLVGLRLGATFAALFTEQQAATGAHDCLRDAPLILWEPITDGAAYFQELLRSNLGTQLAVFGKVRDNREVLQEKILSGGTVNVDGYDIGRALFESCARTPLLPLESKRHQGRTLVVQAAATQAQNPREDLKTLAGSYSNGSYLRVTEQPFWREIKPFYGRAQNLNDATLQWLEQHV